jgi:hypothetical protein
MLTVPEYQRADARRHRAPLAVTPPPCQQDEGRGSRWQQQARRCVAALAEFLCDLVGEPPYLGAFGSSPCHPPFGRVLKMGLRGGRDEVTAPYLERLCSDRLHT